MSTHSDWSWEDMIAACRALGGTIENVRLGTGPRGRGLFSIDNTKPVVLRLPENLLFSTEDIELVGDRVRLKDSASASQPEREFFEKYQKNFSWGSHGRAEWTAFENALDSLPAEIRTLLATEFAMAKRLQGDALARAWRGFLGSRQVGWEDGAVIAPVIELANSGDEALGYEVQDGLRLEGMVADEVLAPYGPRDPWSLFFDYGDAGPSLAAFSLRMVFSVGSNELQIDRDTVRMTTRGNYMVPEIVREGSRISLSHLMLGHAPYPAAPRGIFRALTKEIFGENVDEVFDGIRHFNRSKLLQLLAALESHDGPTIAEMKKMARFQLGGISWSIGSADLNAPVPPPWKDAETLRARRASASSGWMWDAMLEAFRNLGGVAENIRLAYGPSGRGLFPVDREKPFRLRVPPNLLFPVSDILFTEGRIEIRPEAAIGAPEREFFARYQEDFSWGGTGRSAAAAFATGLEDLPSETRDLLAGQFGMGDLFEGDAEERAQKRFLKGTTVHWNGQTFLAPVAELINHRADAVPFGGADSLEIDGESGGEIFVSRRAMDALDFFRWFGFASPEAGAFALPMKTKVGDFELIIKRDVERRATRGAFTIPLLERDGDQVALSFLLLGHAGFPRLPRGIFRALMRSADWSDIETDEAFDRILQFNRMSFVKLLEALAPHDSEAIVMLRKMARFQLEAMSWCIGSREI